MAVAPTPTPATTKRSIRAATEYLLTYERAPGVFEVYNDAGESYVVDVETGACTCPDHQYNLPTEDGREYCKHVRRVMFERGEIDVTPLPATDLRLDPLLLDATGER